MSNPFAYKVLPETAAAGSAYVPFVHASGVGLCVYVTMWLKQHIVHPIVAMLNPEFRVKLFAVEVSGCSCPNKIMWPRNRVSND